MNFKPGDLIELIDPGVIAVRGFPNTEFMFEFALLRPGSQGVVLDWPFRKLCPTTSGICAALEVVNTQFGAVGLDCPTVCLRKLAPAPRDELEAEECA